MNEAESSLGEGNADSAVDSQGARSMPCARARRVWRNRCSSSWLTDCRQRSSRVSLV